MALGLSLMLYKFFTNTTLLLYHIVVLLLYYIVSLKQLSESDKNP